MAAIPPIEKKAANTNIDTIKGLLSINALIRGLITAATLEIELHSPIPNTRRYQNNENEFLQVEGEVDR